MARLPHITAVLAATLVAAGCGGGDGGSSGSEPEPRSARPATMAELVERIASSRSLADTPGIEACDVDVEPAPVTLEDQPGIDSAAAQVVCGTPADDRIEGGDGDDVLVGGSGDDTIYANEENDGAYTADATNVLIGGAGNDTLVDAYGPGLVFAGPGDDEVQVADPAREYVDCGAGTDRVLVAATGTPDELVGCEQIERIDLDPAVLEATADSQAGAS